MADGQAIDGPWTPTTTLPPLLKELPKDGNWDDARAAFPPEPYAQASAPNIVTTNQPSELIMFEGEPALVDVPATSLQWASNTETDVFFDKVGKQWYVLLSGRWFRAPDLKGPWTFATPELPRRFPEHSPGRALLCSPRVRTREHRKARKRGSGQASRPPLAWRRVRSRRRSPIQGEAQFAPIEGTDLAYATNTTETVIKVGSRYFVLQDGVWFVGDSPEGPWQLATEVAEEIYEIPPSSPLYNVTYVRVHDTEPDAVWYSYTMGYLNCFLAWDSCVYGTGWYYPPYWYDSPDYDYPIYYPRPVTWGIGAYYNPVRGVYGRYGYAYGPYRGIAGVRSWNPSTGTYGRAGAAWGPHGSAGFVAAYNPRTDKAGYVAGGRNVYGAWKSAGVKSGSEWARITARTGAGGSSTLRWKTSAGQGFVHEGRRGDMYAGRNGQVYRNTGDGWQVFDGGWQDVKPPERGELLQAGEGLRVSRPRLATASSSAWAPRHLQGSAQRAPPLRFVTAHKASSPSARQSSAAPRSIARQLGAQRSDGRRRNARLRAGSCHLILTGMYRRGIGATSGRFRDGTILSRPAAAMATAVMVAAAWAGAVTVVAATSAEGATEVAAALVVAVVAALGAAAARWWSPLTLAEPSRRRRRSINHR